MSNNSLSKKRYPSIDGLRAFSAIGIIMMHMLSKSNNTYEINGLIADRVIPWFTQLVYLFMMISAFGLSCGYHERMLKGQVDLTSFYKKRYMRILPFFSFLVVLDLIMDFSVKRLLEGFADVTLLFGFLPEPNKLTVIGVGWFIGITFVFYAVFPFFCVLTRTKAAAWRTLIGALIFNFACLYHFMSEEQYPNGFYARQNILFCAMFFVAGTLIFLYREELMCLANAWPLVWILTLIITVIYYVVPAVYESKYVRMPYILLIFTCWLICAVIRDFAFTSLFGRAVKFIAKYSMEIYLCHMMVFRVYQKLGINYLFGKGVMSYIFTVCAVLLGALAVAVVFNFVWSKIAVKRKEVI